MSFTRITYWRRKCTTKSTSLTILLVKIWKAITCKMWTRKCQTKLSCHHMKHKWRSTPNTPCVLWRKYCNTHIWNINVQYQNRLEIFLVLNNNLQSIRTCRDEYFEWIFRTWLNTLINSWVSVNHTNRNQEKSRVLPHVREMGSVKWCKEHIPWIGKTRLPTWRIERRTTLHQWEYHTSRKRNRTNDDGPSPRRGNNISDLHNRLVPESRTSWENWDKIGEWLKKQR